MENIGNLDLKVVTETTILTDGIKETLIEYGNNFKKLDYDGLESGKNEEDMVVGSEYALGKKVWNAMPTIGDYVGWVNIRKGVYAPEWKPLKTYTTDSLIRAVPDNGNVYKCITEGRSMNKKPTFLTNPNVEFYDANGNKWMPQYNYEVDDVVFSTDGSVVFYYICETAGISSMEEPDWNLISSGTTLIDGSVTWRKEKTVKWKQVNTSSNFRPFGEIK